MKIISLKSNARKTLTNQKALYASTETHKNLFWNVSFHIVSFFLYFKAFYNST